MDYEKVMTLGDVEDGLIEWAESGEEGEGRPACLRNWDLNEGQLEIIRGACANPHAAAIIANVMYCMTDEEGLAIIAEVLRDH